VPQDVLTRDIRQTWVPHDGVQAMWEVIYRDPTAYWQAYELAEKLVDFEDYFRRWRFNHLTTVARVIGIKRGTGGTSGISYLRRMLDVELFPELWSVRTTL
jgi:tryptophan 2,3-dioxygenase